MEAFGLLGIGLILISLLNAFLGLVGGAIGGAIGARS